MAGHGMERRHVLRVMALGAVAARFTGFHRWAFVCDHSHAAEGATKPDHYTPQFFTLPEYATLERLTEIINPSDATPGARKARVSEFIDFMVWSDPSVQYRFRYGLTWLDARCDQLHGKTFRELDTEQQIQLLAHLAYKGRFRIGEEDGQAFFQLIHEYTVMDFYTTKIGLEQIDCPALKHFYPGSPACPHTEDRAHAHLPEPEELQEDVVRDGR